MQIINIFFFYQEIYGEDFYLFGIYVSYFVQGLQGDYDRYIQVNVGCKYFDVYGGLEDIFEFRMGFDVKVNQWFVCVYMCVLFF